MQGTDTQTSTSVNTTPIQNTISNYNLLEPVNFNNPNSNSNLQTSIAVSGNSGSDFNQYIQNIFLIVLMIIVSISIFMLMYGGVLYLTKDIGSKVAAGKKMIAGVFSGLVFIFTIWILFYLVNPKFMSQGIAFKVLSITGIIKEQGPTSDSSGIVGVTGCDGTIVDIGVPSNSSYKICSSIKDNLINMINAAKNDGIDLTIASAYRMADSCAVSSGTCASSGKSNHQKGLAVDFNGFKNGPASDPRYKWLQANASKYRFYNNLVPKYTDEYNHWSITGN